MGFPICHMVKYGNDIHELVVVPSKDTWTRYRKYGDYVMTETSDDYDEMDDAFNTAKSAIGYMSVGSQSEAELSTVEDVSDDDIKSFIKQVTGK